MQIIMDTGPLVASIDQRDKYHSWAVSQLAALEGPAWTCEAVLTEAYFLLQRVPYGTASLSKLLSRGALEIVFSAREEHQRVTDLIKRFSTVPMSFADACLVRMSELHSEAYLLTLDKDFLVYRRHSRQTIPVIAPFK